MLATWYGDSCADEYGDASQRSTDGESLVAGWGDQLAAQFSPGDWSTPPGKWSKEETENFLIHANGTSDDELGDLATACEACLKMLGDFGQQERSRDCWQPKCTVVLHRTPESYENALGRRAGNSWGCTTIKSSHGVITSRRIDICATTPQRLAETLPHELTHAVLADRFAGQAVPRWLDEGLAVLAEPRGKIARRARVLNDDADAAPLLRSAELFAVDDYPTGQQCHLFYVESVRLVSLLLRDGGPERLFFFAETGTRRGYDAALREHYGLAGMSELDQRRQETNTAGLVAQASREEKGTATAQKTSDSPVLDAAGPIVNVSYRRPPIPLPGESPSRAPAGRPR